MSFRLRNSYSEVGIPGVRSPALWTESPVSQESKGNAEGRTEMWMRNMGWLTKGRRFSGYTTRRPTCTGASKNRYHDGCIPRGF